MNLSLFDLFGEREPTNHPGAASQALGDPGIVNELTGQRRHRVFAYEKYLDILSEGAQPL